MRNTDFIDDTALSRKMNRVAGDIVTLGNLLENQEEPDIQSCLRKTMIIYIASIIEALLLWKLKKEITKEKVTLRSKWKYYDFKKIYTAEECEIGAVKRKGEVKKLDAVDFNTLIDLCEEHTIVKKKNLITNLHAVRKMRNEQHIGGIRVIRKTYTQKDLDTVSNTLEKITHLIKQ